MGSTTTSTIGAFLLGEERWSTRRKESGAQSSKDPRSQLVVFGLMRLIRPEHHQCAFLSGIKQRTRLAGSARAAIDAIQTARHSRVLEKVDSGSGRQCGLHSVSSWRIRYGRRRSRSGCELTRERIDRFRRCRWLKRRRAGGLRRQKNRPWRLACPRA